MVAHRAPLLLLALTVAGYLKGNSTYVSGQEASPTMGPNTSLVAGPCLGCE
jgi:hypothetical protein